MRGKGSVARALVCAGLLAGCAHLPGDATRLDREAAHATPEPPARAANGRPALADVPSSQRDAEDYEDLLERMRRGFSLPLEEHPRVRGEIEWYAAHSDYLERCFGRGRRYLHHIVETLEQRNMPRELALLPVVESAFDPFARSPSLASGLWQFIPSTGRRYGLDQDWWRDGRRDVLAATRAALDHLQELHAEFDGDWLLALAAYNAGAGSVKRAMERNLRSGRPTDFFHLELLPETEAYVPKLLAVARLVAEPEEFGIEFPAIPNAPYFAQVNVGEQVDLGLVADLAEIPRAELRALNPEFKRFATAPDGPHQLLVPAEARERFERVLTTLPASKRLRFVRHRVRPGDTLFAIARRYGVPLEAVRSVNRLRGSLIHPGQELLVPLPSAATAATQPTPARRRGGLAS